MAVVPAEAGTPGTRAARRMRGPWIPALAGMKGQGSPAVASWGFSLGGWLAGLHLCASPAQDAAVLMTPVSNLERAVRELEFCHPIRAALAVAPANLRPLNLHSRVPCIDPVNIRLVEAQYDLFVPSPTCHELARAWKLADWDVARQSHITILTSRRDTRATIEWLASRLGK